MKKNRGVNDVFVDFQISLHFMFEKLLSPLILFLPTQNNEMNINRTRIYTLKFI